MLRAARDEARLCTARAAARIVCRTLQYVLNAARCSKTLCTQQRGAFFGMTTVPLPDLCCTCSA
eukprot:2532171-Heterocapsa_arctica.AAC.1